MCLVALAEKRNLPKTYILVKIRHFLHEGIVILEKIDVNVTWVSEKNNSYFVFFQVAYLHWKWETRHTSLLLN